MALHGVCSLQGKVTINYPYFWFPLTAFVISKYCTHTTTPHLHTCKHTLHSTPCRRILIDQLTVLWLVNKFPAFYGNQRFITIFTKACHLSLSQSRQTQSVPCHPISSRNYLILHSHQRLGIGSVVSFLQVPHQYTCTHSSSPPCVSHSLLPSFDHTNNIWQGVHIPKLIPMQFSSFSWYFQTLRT